MTREIVLDTETTGLDPRTGDRVVEIGAVEIINRFPTGESYHVYINPERDMPMGAFEVHGLSEEFLSDKPVFADVAAAFTEFVAGDMLVIHNATFDVGFLNMELEKLGHPRINNDLVVDTLAIARRRHPAGPNSLDALCRRYGIDNSKRTKHGALLDAELLADVYLELTGGRQAHLSLDPVEVTQEAGPQATAQPAHRRPEPLPSRLTDEDQQKHTDFVDTLGDKAIWKIYRD